MDIIQITDLHITKNINQRKNNCIPYKTLLETLEAIRHNHSDIRNLVITGDMSNDYTAESYTHIRDLLKNYKFKITLLPGNHDNYDSLKLILDDQISIQSLDLSEYNSLSYNFDTHIHEMITGRVKINQINDLCNILENSPETQNVLIFTHHPLIPVGSRWIDKHVCDNSNLLIDMMLSYKNISFKIFSGHVHQEFHLKNHNVEFFTTPSTCYQFKAFSENFEIDESLTYGYRVISLHDKTISTKVRWV